MNKVTMNMEQGIEAIMEILGDAGLKEQTVVPTVVDSSKVRSGKMGSETVYDGRGHVVSVNGKKAHTGYVKGAKRVKNAKDTARGAILDAAEVILNRVAAFEGKVGRNTVDGVIVRMADADYTVKVAGHAKKEFENREEGFKAEVSYLTRGKAENHSPAIAKILVAEIENENSDFKIENQNQLTLLSAKAGTVRFEIQNSNGDTEEFSFKITKKRARVVMN